VTGGWQATVELPSGVGGTPDDLFRVEAAMSATKKYGYSSFAVGAVLAVLFGILSGATSGTASTSYLAAAIVCAVAGVVGLLIGIFAK
jgi:hypothetical protein